MGGIISLNKLEIVLPGIVCLIQNFLYKQNDLENRLIPDVRLIIQLLNAVTNALR